jgi:chromosome segregation ATPase
MFRLLDLSLHGWDLWPAVRIPLDSDIVLVTGPNGSGKTTLLDALRQLLNAPRLSSRRRLQHYLRSPGVPALLWATVSNGGEPGTARPFARERVATPEATLACALVPGAAGAPEKRFAILAGRAGVEQVRRTLLESRDFYGPERYARALEHAGVTRSLMNVLAIEQGRTNSLFELKPRQLFAQVLDMLGDRAVLERYRSARSRYEESEREVDAQTRVLHLRQAELQRVQREVDRRARWERDRERVEDLTARLPAAELQAELRSRREATSKIPELQTKVSRGRTELARRELDLGERRREEGEAERQREESVAHERAAEGILREAIEAAAALRQQLADLESRATRARAMPERELEACERREQETAWALFEAQQSLVALREEESELAERTQRLRAGLPVYPAVVRETLEALEREEIPFALLAERVELRDPSLARSIEAALDDARFGLVVSPQDEERALAFAREHAFPGPVDASPSQEETITAGSLELRPGSPRWLERWLRETKLSPDGAWVDERGSWVRPARGWALGKAGIEAALAEAEAALRACHERVTEAIAWEESARGHHGVAQAELTQERERRTLLSEVGALPGVRDALASAEGAERSAEVGRETTRRAREEAEATLRDRAQTRRLEEERLGQLRIQHEGESNTLQELELRARALEARISELSSGISPELRERAERGELDGADTVRADLERAQRDLEAHGEPPAEEIREEARHLEANVRELEGHVRDRGEEARRARGELDACRQRYLEIVSRTLQDYRRRCVEIGARADVAVEMDLPALGDDDRALDEAAIDVRLGFDGKEPVSLGDPSFSGGQQVIAGLVLLMAMAETGGSGFFMLDEPFAHLSLDRIDQVGRFLRSTRAQFILTAPTTLDRAQLDPASQLIVLRKKRPADPAAPLPVVAQA